MLFKNSLLLSVIFLILFTACKKDEAYLPKPKGYHRIDLPKHNYVRLDSTMPYTFEYSSLASIVPDESFMTEPYWIEILYPKFDAKLTISYKEVKNNLDSLIELTNDSHKLTTKHHVKATAIDDYMVLNPSGKSAILSYKSASFAAFIISSLVLLLDPKEIFSSIVSEKRKTSCGT